MSETRYQEVEEIVTDIFMNFVSYIKVNNKRQKFFSLTLKGTVASGHPTRTTLGNSLRVILYNKFMLYWADIKKFSLSVGGDDTFILVERKNKAAMEDIFW